jgi:hypothetical protein
LAYARGYRVQEVAALPSSNIWIVKRPTEGFSRDGVSGDASPETCVVDPFATMVGHQVPMLIRARESKRGRAVQNGPRLEVRKQVDGTKIPDAGARWRPEPN